MTDQVTETIAFRLTPAEKQIVAAAAARQDRTISQLIRRLVREHHITKDDQQ